ncbi:TPA: ABC transporter substrate-binding protein [Enterococcus faecalis]|nr:ABC transporter substrate-binding protein [Enterococcus faecalis]
MKKFICLFTGLFLLTACGSSADVGRSNSGNTVEGNTIKIGMNMELSGDVSAYGNAEKEGIKLAIEEINKSGGVLGKKIELIEKDNKSENGEATSVAANLTVKDKVVAVVGPATSGATKATIPNMTKSGVPVITPSGTEDSITVMNNKVQKYVFRACFQDTFQGVILAKFAQENLKAKNVVIIGDNSSDYAIGLTKSFKKTYKGKITKEETFTSGDKDFYAILTKIKDLDYDAIYIPGYYAEAGLIIKQAREMGINKPILGADGFGDEKLVEIAGSKNVSDVYYTGHFSEKAPATEKVKPFVKMFKEKYRKQPSAFNALGYDSVYMLKQAIEDKNSADSKDITAGLASLKDFIGVTGKMTIDKDHNPEKSAVVLGLTEGKETSAESINP